MNKNIVGICLILLFSLNISFEVSANEGSGSLTIIHSALLDIEHSYFSNRNENTEKAALDKQAGLFQKIRGIEPDLLIVNVGNVFLSTDTIGSKSQAILKAYAKLDYEAINLSYRDFHQGKKVTNNLIKSGKIPFISANLIDENTGELLAKPFIIKNTPAGKTAILGVTQSPAGLKILPHLQQQLAGIHIDPPVEALQKWMPKAKTQADHVVLLYYGSYAGLKPIKEAFGSELATIIVGGTRAEYLPKESVPPIIGTSGNGEHVALVKLNLESEAANAEVKQIPLDANILSDPEIQKFIGSDFSGQNEANNNSTSVNQPKKIIIGEPTDSMESKVPQPEITETDQQPASLMGRNEAVELTVVDYELVENINNQKAKKDHVFVVLSTHWKNILKEPKKDVPWAHRSLGNFSQTKPDIEIAFLSNKKEYLFLETEGKNKMTLSLLTKHLPMPLTGKQFKLSNWGDEAEAQVAFQINKTTLRSPVLTLLDPNYGDIRINLPRLQQAILMSEQDKQHNEKDRTPQVTALATDDQEQERAISETEHQNLSSFATLNVSSFNTGVRVYSPKRAIDGNLDTSWFTADGDAANQGKTPFFELIFDKEVIVSELKMFGNREYANGYDFISGVFQLFDQSGNELYNSKVVELPAPHRDISLSIPGISDVRRVRFTSVSDESIEPGFAEMEVIGMFEASSNLQDAEEIEKGAETTETQTKPVVTTGSVTHSASNEFIKLLIDDVEIVSTINNVSAGEGYEFVVVSLGMQYLTPERGEYAISNIAEHLFLLAGESYTVEVASETKMLGNTVFPQRLKLSRNLLESKGKVVFRVRKDDLKALSIVLLDTRFSNLTVPLQGTVGKMPDNTKFGTYRKGKLEAAVYGVECLKEQCYVDIGLKSGINNTTLQYHLSSSIYLVRDGYDYVPLAEANAPYNLQKVTLFNPDHERRGFYPLPKLEDNTHYGLYLGLPDGHHFTATLTPEQNLPTLPTPQKIFSDGSVAEISILGFKQVEKIADIKPSQGSRLLVLDLLVSSPSGSNAYLNIEPSKQFQLQNKGGKKWKAKALVYPKDGTVQQVFKHYAGMESRFALVYEVPESQQKLRLEYSGFQEQKILPLILKTLSGEEVYADEIKPGLNAVLSEYMPDADGYYPADVFSDEIKNLYLVMTSSLDKNVKVNINWFATEVEGIKQDEKLTKTATMHFKPGQSGIFTFKAPKGGFKPGKYRVELLMDGQQKKILPFEIHLKYPPAELITDESQVPVGFNIAFSALGGNTEHWTSEKDNSQWAAKNLIDGKAIYFQRMDLKKPCRSCGWSSKDAKTPQEIVFSFYKKRTAQIHGVTIDSTTYDSQHYPGEVVKYAEVWVSQKNPDRGFKKISGARLGSEAGRYLIRLPETAARYVKIIFLSNYAGNTFQAGEVEIIEKAEQEASILRDYPKNLATPDVGGGLVRWSSQTDYHQVGYLIDGTTKTEGWYSRGLSKPQDFLFQFDKNQKVLIDEVRINPQTAWSEESWVKRIQVAVSSSGNPLEGFENIGEFVLSKVPVLQSFKINRYARYVRVRILDTQGAKHGTTLGEVQLIEGWEPGYTSIFLRRDSSVTVEKDSEVPVLLVEHNAISEQEPNDKSGQANKLEIERFATGKIDPLGEKDIWKLQVPGNGRVITNFEIKGTPNIRTSYSLVGQDGKLLQRFDPSHALGTDSSFEWTLDAGEHLIEVTEPPVSVVVIWDTSGSMEGSTRALQGAVESYLGQLRPEDRVALIRFSDDVEVVAPLDHYSKETMAATEGKFNASGGTALYDAVLQGMGMLEGVRGNRAILLMTDGEDSRSKKHNSDLWNMIEKKRIRIYSIGLGEHWDMYHHGIGNSGKRFLSNLALATNGKSFFAPSKNELKSIYQKISDELQQISTYYLKPQIVKNVESPVLLEKTDKTIDRSPEIMFNSECPETYRKADFVFLIDGTNSMGDEIKAVKQGLSSFVDRLEEQKLDARFAVVLFGGPPELVLDFTKDHNKVRTTLDKISVNYSVAKFQENHNVNPEAGLEAIRTVLNVGSSGLHHQYVGGDGQLHYRPDARINLILVTDEDSDRPYHSGNRLPGQKDEDPPNDIKKTDWQREIDRTAQAVSRQQAFLNMLISTDDIPSRHQYGDPSSDVSDENLLNFDAKATLKQLKLNGFTKSLETQVLSAGLIARTFDIKRVNDPVFVKNFYDTKVVEILKHCMTINDRRPKGKGYLAVAATHDVLAGPHPTQIELILDASGSMRERKRKIDGRLKIDVAKDVMHELIDGLPEGMEVGLRVYGHRIREGRKGDCQDSELLVPFGKLDKDRLHQQVAGMRALGTTPLAYSLLKAGEDFSTGTGEKILILVTDGKEECGMDPAFAARTLISKGLKVRVDVVGFALAEEKTKADMRQVAAITGGRFYDAQDRTELLNALRRAISLPYQVFDSDGKQVATGTTGGVAKKLRDGIYTVKVQPPGQPILEFKDVHINEKQYTRLELHLDQKQVKPQIRGPFTQQAAEQIQFSGEPMQRSVTIDKQSSLQALLTETEDGLRVKAVTYSGLAQQAGIRVGDLITYMDGKPLRHEMDLRRTLKLVAEGKKPSSVITVRRAVNEIAIEVRGKQKKQWQIGVTSKPKVNQSERVRHAQGWLSQLGFKPGPADGLWGGKTAQAVKDFQRWYPDDRLAVTGQLDSKTYQALESAVRKGLKRTSTTKKYKPTTTSEQRRRQIERQQREEQRRREAEAQQRQKQVIDKGINFLREMWGK